MCSAAPNASAAVILIYTDGEERNQLAVWTPVRFRFCEHLGLKTGA